MKMIIKKTYIQKPVKEEIKTKQILREIEIFKLIGKGYELRYRPDQPRDDHGRWVSEGGSVNLTDNANNGTIYTEGLFCYGDY
jgi:hypothetical protein